MRTVQLVLLEGVLGEDLCCTVLGPRSCVALRISGSAHSVEQFHLYEMTTSHNIILSYK